MSHVLQSREEVGAHRQGMLKRKRVSDSDTAELIKDRPPNLKSSTTNDPASLTAARAACAAPPTQDQRLSSIVDLRFKRALKTSNVHLLLSCMESGHVPSRSQWVWIISKLHVSRALKCVHATKKLDASCIQYAIKRQHPGLFRDVIARTSDVPASTMENLMTVPASYLDACLKKGLDPNIKLKSGRLPLEHACANSRLAHIETLLHDERTVVSQNVCRFMIRQQKQQKFAQRGLELCDNVVPAMILEAVVYNVSSALILIMKKIEPVYENNPKWDTIEHMMRCPILQEYSTDIVKTVNNHYYDRESLLTWVRSKGTDPMTRENLRESDLLLRSEFLKEYATSLQVLINEL